MTPFLEPTVFMRRQEILRTRLLKFSLIPLAILVAIGFYGLAGWLARPATAAAPAPSQPELIPNVAQDGDISLEKQVSSPTVPLGQPVTYTVRIENRGARATDFNLVDELPQGLALQVHSLSVTTGISDTERNKITWSGTLAEGASAEISYAAIPPSTSSPGEIVENVAVLQAGGRTLEAAATITTEPPDVGLWGRFVNGIGWILVETELWLERFGLPYAFGFAIILFTVVVRGATFPLNMQQIKSSKAMQELQPKMKELQEKYKNDREKLAQEQMALYKEHGVNPLGGCLPLLVQMPIWIALYRALINLSNEGLLNEGFFWIPSLAGPVSTQGASFPPEWIWPLVGGVPPLGWSATIAYLILPILLVVSQVYMQQMMTPPSTDPQQQSMQQVMKFMPLMFGYFALVVPAGLTLYWFTSNILALLQQYFTKTQLQNDSTESKKRPLISSSLTDNTPLPANSTSTDGAAAISGEDGKSTNAKSKRKRRKR